MGIKKRTTFDERFEHFKQDIRGQIVNGTLRPGEFLVSEVKLAELYGISKNPVRRILAELEQEGLIEKIPCIGNRVCSPPQSAHPTFITLMVYEVCYELDVYKRAIALFEELHPGVKVKLDIVPNAIYAQRIVETLAENDGADLILLSDHHYFQIDYSGHTGLFEELGGVEFPVINELYPQLLGMFETEGKLRSMPLTFSPVVYCCNKGIIADPEGLQLEDWSDLLKVARRYTISDPDGLIRQYGLASTISVRRWLVFLLQNGGILPGAKTGDLQRFDHEACAEALRFFTELSHNNLLSAEAQGGLYADHFLFENNRVALMMSSYYFMNDLQQLPIRWDVLPFMPGSKSNSTLLIGSGIGIPQTSAKKALARSFVRLLASAEVQGQLKRTLCSIPAHRSIAENLELFNPDIHPAHYHAFIGFMTEAVPLMKLGVDYGQLHRITRELIYLWSRMESAETVWSRIQEQVLAPVRG